MATHELYVGGPSSRNIGLSMYPAVPFNEAAKPFTDLTVAAHKGPAAYNDTRYLDFVNDNALAEFLRENTVAAADVLGLIIIPKNMLFLGFYYKVENPQAGLTLTPALRGKATVFTAIDASAAAEGFVAPGGGAIITEGAVDLSAAVFDNKPDILDIALTAFPAGGFGNLILTVSPVLVSTNMGGRR